MELGIWTSYYANLSPEDAVAELKKHGISACELSDEHASELLHRGDAKTVGKAFGDYCKEIGMKVPQGHLYLKLRLCDETQPVVAIFKNWLDLFLSIGINRAVLHLDGLFQSPELTLQEKREKNAAVLSQLLDHVKGTDLVICLENLSAIDCGNKRDMDSNADLLLWFIDYFKSENLGICLDTGHLNVGLGNQVDFIEKAGSHLKALHLHDNEGEKDQHLLPFGRGSIDFPSVVTALEKIGFAGIFNFEIPGESQCCPMELRGYKLEYIKHIYDYLMK